MYRIENMWFGLLKELKAPAVAIQSVERSK
jgi:hypothetical protein